MNFVALTQWLLELCGSKNSGWNQYDDPGTVTNNIVLDLKKLGLTLNYPATKLKHGFGDACVQTLLDLGELALQAKRFKFRSPVIPDDDEDQGDDEEDDMEGDADLANVGMADLSEDEDIAELVEAEEVVEKDEEKEMIEGAIDPDEWEREFQRVTHKLKISKKLDADDWRGHLEQTDKHVRAMREQIPDVRARLEQVTDEVTRDLERISKKEHMLNKTTIGTSGRQNAQQAKAVAEEHNAVKAKVEELEAQYYEIEEELTKIEGQVNDLGKAVSDQSPLLKIKKAIEKAKKDVKNIDIRIGVVSTIIMQTKVPHDDSTDASDNLFDEEDMEL